MMDVYISRKRRRSSPSARGIGGVIETNGEDDTDTKIAILASLYPDIDHSVVLDDLINAEGSVEAASSALQALDEAPEPHKRKLSHVGIGYQSSLSCYHVKSTGLASSGHGTLTKKGQTLHLYAPEDVAAHSPCSIIHNFLPAEDAAKLLRELLEEAKTFESQTFKIFDRVVQSPHGACFYVESNEERRRQQTDYLYNGSNLTVGLEITATSEID